MDQATARYEIEERRAIKEFDGELPREEAERSTAREMWCAMTEAEQVRALEDIIQAKKDELLEAGQLAALRRGKLPSKFGQAPGENAVFWLLAWFQILKEKSNALHISK